MEWCIPEIDMISVACCRVVLQVLKRITCKKIVMKWKCDNRLTVMALLWCCLFVKTADAQVPRALYKQKGEYLPMAKNLPSYQALNNGFSAAQIRSLNDNMAAFMELMHKTPCINPPRGFEVGTYAGICGDGACHESKVMAGSAGYIIREWTITENNPVPERAAEGPGINVLFNDIRSMLKQGVYVEPALRSPL